VNTIGKFYKEEEEMVKKLDFYNPEALSLKSLFSLKVSKECAPKIIGRRKRSMDDARVFSHQKGEKEQVRQSSNDVILPDISNDLNLRLREIENDNILSKNLNVKKMENLANENRLETERRELTEKINAIKNERNENTNNLLNIQKEIQNMEIGVGILAKDIKINDTTTNNKIETLKTFRRQATRNTELLHMAMILAQKEFDKKDRLMSQIKTDIESQLKEKETLRININNCKIKLDTLNKKLNLVKNQLMLHYHVLLNEGRDTRHEGLAWIIKAIWNLGCNVIISYLPNFLDEKAIEYLFSSAQKDVELHKLKTQIDDTKLIMKCSIKDKKQKRSLMSSDFFKTKFNVSQKIIFLIHFLF
jgi:hypothetical protein